MNRQALIVKNYLLSFCCVLGLSFSSWADDELGIKKFKVCADPNYLPMSHRNLDGYENRIARLFADELGLELEYYWFPQRLGFIRNTLRKKDDQGDSLCDFVMGVPAGYELVKPSIPWYRSTYVIAYVKGRGFDHIKTPADLASLPPEERKNIRIGMHERNPGVRWMANNDMLEQLVPYIAQLGDPKVGPGELEGKDLLDGKVDMVILWGPLAAQLKRSTMDEEIAILPIASDPDSGLVMDYSIAMGVHFPNGELAVVLNELIRKKRDDIRQILTDYHVPLLELKESDIETMGDDDDDDD